MSEHFFSMSQHFQQDSDPLVLTFCGFSPTCEENGWTVCLICTPAYMVFLISARPIIPNSFTNPGVNGMLYKTGWQ